MPKKGENKNNKGNKQEKGKKQGGNKKNKDNKKSQDCTKTLKKIMRNEGAEMPLFVNYSDSLALEDSLPNGSEINTWSWLPEEAQERNRNLLLRERNFTNDDEYTSPESYPFDQPTEDDLENSNCRNQRDFDTTNAILEEQHLLDSVEKNNEPSSNEMDSIHLSSTASPETYPFGQLSEDIESSDDRNQRDFSAVNGDIEQQRLLDRAEKSNETASNHLPPTTSIESYHSGQQADDPESSNCRNQRELDSANVILEHQHLLGSAEKNYEPLSDKTAPNHRSNTQQHEAFVQRYLSHCAETNSNRLLSERNHTHGNEYTFPTSESHHFGQPTKGLESSNCQNQRDFSSTNGVVEQQCLLNSAEKNNEPHSNETASNHLPSTTFPEFYHSGQPADDSENSNCRNERGFDSSNAILEQRNLLDSAEKNNEPPSDKTDSNNLPPMTSPESFHSGQPIEEIESSNCRNQRDFGSPNTILNQQNLLDSDKKYNKLPFDKADSKQQNSNNSQSSKNKIEDHSADIFPVELPRRIESNTKLKQLKIQTESPAEHSKTGVTKQRSNKSSNSNDENIINDADGSKMEEVKEKIVSKPPVSEEQLREFSFPNCPTQDLSESEKLVEHFQQSFKMATIDLNSNSELSSEVLVQNLNPDSVKSAEVVTRNPNPGSVKSAEVVTKSPNPDSVKSAEVVTKSLNPDSVKSSEMVTKNPNPGSAKSAEVVTKSPNPDSVKSAEVVTKSLNPDSEKSSVKEKTFSPDSSENASDEEFHDAPEDVPFNQPSPSFMNIAQRGVEPNLTKPKSKWYKPAKKSPATNSSILYCSDKKQHIKKKFKNGVLNYSAKLIFHHSVLVSQGEVCYEILGKRNLLISDKDNFIARIEVAPGEELDFTKAFRNNKAALVNRITMVKVLDDELLVQRNEAYVIFKKILEARSERISDFQDIAEDFLQISMILKTYHFYSERILLLLKEIKYNEFISHELKCGVEHLLNCETNFQKRNKLFPKCTCPSFLSHRDLYATLQDICKNGLEIHKQSLKKKCSTQNSYLLLRILEINKLPVEKLLRVTNDDIKLFTDLMTLTTEESQTVTSIIPSKFVDNLWSNFHCKLLSDSCKSLVYSGPLTHPIHFFLVKTLRDLIEDIIAKSTTIAPELFKKVKGDYVISKNISWSLNCSANKSLQKQYNLVYELMKHFEPGNYTHKKKFNYKFALLENVDDSSFWQAIKGLVIKNKSDLFKMPEERLIWLYIVDCGIAPILHGESNERFKNLSLALLSGFLKFIQNARHIRYESFRIAAHNIVKFAAQILPYFKVTNAISQDLDHSILDKQIDFINGILTSDEGDVISNLFSNLMDVYIEYWELRESIIGKLKRPCALFNGLVDDIMLKILEIVDNTLSKQVELQLVIQYFRMFNEFVKHFKGINFAWFISKNVYLEEMKDSVKEINKGKKTTYEVTNPEKFLDILREKDKQVPQHFLLETVSELLKIINTSLNKSNWPDEDRLKAAGDLFLAIGHTFAHFEDQTDYTDIELFKRDCTTPFKSVIDNSSTYSDFKVRLDNVENYYLYARKQNQIGIQQALELCESEVKAAQENGFRTSIDKKILEECFNRYSDKMALLQKLDINEIVEDLREQLKKVDVLPLERWTPHFKQTVLPVLLANLAGIWTILESKDVCNIEKRIEPHCIQIICVLRLIGADYLQNGVPKHFAQVLTGQGKSIILGLLSSLIALTGHKANIVCYSKYLAVRDQNAFSSFFKTFDALTSESKISYYTFDNMAEDVMTRKINGEEVSLRKIVNDVILNKLETKTIEKVENSADDVLLIDEVDVFFSENFYGQTYNPCSTIGMAALREIQPKLWEIVEGGTYDKNVVLERIREFINELLKDEKYEDFKNFLSSTSALFEENLDRMVTVAISVSKEKNNPDMWFVQKYKLDYNGVICYRERLGFYCSNTYIGYNNVFNYFRLKKNNYDDKNFQNFGYFFIIWGYISYANLPLAYKNILGVSGTLMTLTNHEKNAIKNYKIETMSAMPSFFGDRSEKFTFNPNEHFTIENSVNNWHSKIFSHISKIIQDNRACLVFFDTDSEIKEFENKYRNNINRLYTLVGNEEPKTMEWRINEAGVAQTVTLASRAMGRGVDYKSNDRSVEEKGGVHAIQTFFSLDEKEETQIKGRVARKDNKGSYELIVCREHLKEIDCSEKTNETPITTYQELCDARLAKANSKGAIIEARIRESEKEHNLTMAFLKSLTKYTPKERQMYFSKYPFVKPE